MPTVRRSRELAASRETVWEIVSDARKLALWWPRVQRVESPTRSRWTTVMTTEKGKAVRADYRLVDSHAQRERTWEQELEGSPFERILREAMTRISLDRADGGTLVTLEVYQRFRGLNRLGGLIAARAARRQLDEALEGLERVCVG